MISTKITVLTEPDAADFLHAAQAERGEDAWPRLTGFVREMQDGQRTIWLAKRDDALLGMVTLRWRSDYPGFQRLPPAPEIVDLYTWQNARRQGIATALLQAVEDEAMLRGHRRIGLCVGVLAEDAFAWGFYLKRGYGFDGTGGWSNGRPIADDSVIHHGRFPVLLMMDKLL